MARANEGADQNELAVGLKNSKRDGGVRLGMCASVGLGVELEAREWPSR